MDSELRSAADDGKLVTGEWLCANGWTRHTRWPSIGFVGGSLLEWRGAGMWVGEMPICLTPTRGHVRRLCTALGIEVKKS